MIHKAEWAPDKGHPGGWGIGQVDRGDSKDTTAEGWDWRTNALSPAQTFLQKK